MRQSLSYVLPARWPEPCPLPDLPAYLRDLAGAMEVIVVDGSAPDVFAANAALFGSSVTHIPVDPRLPPHFAKVGGVLTGVARARGEIVVIADDDVRWDLATLSAARSLMRHADLLVPQNYFDALPWHARWDTARSLIGRALGGDYPGTLVLRRSVLLAAGGYDGEALFENLELCRTVQQAGGRIVRAPSLAVRRRPPSAAHFWSQRVRQAYDELARPARLAVELALLPLALALAARRPRALLAMGIGSILLAEAGRRRARGRDFFPPTAALWAPLWVGERAVCSWIAVAQRVLAGGTPYAGRPRRLAANPPRVLRHRLRAGGYPYLRELTEPVLGRPGADTPRRDRDWHRRTASRANPPSAARGAGPPVAP